jgi:hypothetical protein
MATIRPATENDIQTMSQIGAEAFFDDELFGPLIHPHRNEFPDDMHLYWLKRIHRDWCVYLDERF